MASAIICVDLERGFDNFETMKTSDAPLNSKHTEKYSEAEKTDILLSLEAAAKAARGHSKFQTDLDVERAIQHLVRFVNLVKPCPQFDETTANTSAAIHTYLRKGCDNAITTLLYVLVARNEGMGVWHAFCTSVAKHYADKKQNIHVYINEIERYYRDNESVPANDTMYFALKAWLEGDEGEEFLCMLKTFKKDGWLE